MHVSSGIVARRPAVAAVLLFIAGILLHRLLPVMPWIWVGVIALLLGITLAHQRNPIRGSISLALAIVCCGLALAQLREFHFASTDIAHYALDSPRLAQIEMKIDYPPRILAHEFEATQRPIPPRQVFTATVTRVREWEEWRPATGKLLVSIDQPHPLLAIRQHIRVTGMLQRPSPAMNPGQFDWARYYRKQRIVASIQVRTAGNVQILNSPSPHPLDRLRAIARRSLAMGFDTEQSLDHALLAALLVGDRDPQVRDIQEQFARTGTSHHLAISGLHIAVLGGFVFVICRLITLPPRTTAWIGASFVLLYGLITQPSAPVIRSVLLCLFIGGGLLSRRSLDMVHLLAISALVMLIYDPLDLYSAGFQLSFGTVLGLVILTTPMLEVFRRPNPLDVVRGPPASHREAARRWVVLRSEQVFAAALVAWLVSLPLVAYHFERLNPWAMFGSIALAPVVFIALILGLIKVVLTLVLPSGAEAWAVLCVWPITLMRWMVDWLALLPGSDMPLPRPTMLFIALYYAALCLPLLLWRGRFNIWQPVRLTPAATCLVILCLPLLIGARSSPAVGSLRATILAVGAGSCTVVELPDQRVILIDAGSLSLSDPVNRCIEPFLRSRGVRRIDAIYISHADYDHYSAVAELAELYHVDEVWISPQFRIDAADIPPAQRMLRQLDRRECAVYELSAGDHHERSGAEIEVLWPPATEQFARANDNSLVLRVRYGGRSILFPGDVQVVAQERLLSSGVDLGADVLIAPHHGSFVPPDGHFIAAVRPSIIISSNDRTLSARQKDYAAIALPPLLRTHSHGAVTIELSRDGELTLTPFHRVP